MSALTMVVGAGIFVPIPDQWFYLTCMAVELVVAIMAYRIGAAASSMVIRMSAMLMMFHGLGWVFDGYPEYSPYHIAVKFLEHAELIVCILLSPPIKKRFYNV